MAKNAQPKPIRLSGVNRTGRPTKKTKSLIATLVRLISGGGPFELCCQAVGITRETFCDWRGHDPVFAKRIEQAAATGSLARLNKIERHGEKDWHSLGWMLERQHPQYFARAETQLTVTAQAAVVNGNGDKHNIETIVISDLEFVGLKRHPAYEHRRATSEVEQVPPELSGTLERKDQNIIVLSESKAAANAQRLARIRPSP